MVKTIEIQCSDEMKDIIVEALRLYAHMAFPSSASPCQMVSRDALYNAADEFEERYAKTGKGCISNRMRVMLKSAVKNYFSVQAEQTGMATDRQCRVIVEVCSGQPGTQQELDDARAADTGSGT